MGSVTNTSKRCILIDQAVTKAGLSAKLKKSGLEVLNLPLSQTKVYSDIDSLTDVFAEIAWYEWVIFTSPETVKYFFEFFFKKFKDIRCLGPMRVACMNIETQKELERYFIQTDIIPEETTYEGLGKVLLTEGSLDNTKILVVCKKDDASDFIKFLGNNMAIVDALPVYESTDISILSDVRSFLKDGADIVLFQSKKHVESFMEQAGNLKLDTEAKKPKTCALTSEAVECMKLKGMPVDLVISDLAQAPNEILDYLS